MTALPPRLKDRSPTREDTKRLRSPAHTAWVRSHGCCVPGCERQPIEAAHVRDGLPAGEQAGGGLKPGDHWTISLCHHHHIIEQHQMGERAFEKKYGIDMKALAQEFARRSPKLKGRRR